ncbi:MAG TPA: tetratricopeptide repeat protein [Candidatus Angelobacter sp.]
MKTHLRFCLLLCSLVICASADTPQWVEIRSPHFSVVTDAGEKRGREVALRFEQMRAVFGKLMAKAKVNLPIPLEIVAFRNSKEFKQFVPLWHGKPTQLAGLFQPGEDRCFIMLDLSVENSFQVVFHEYAHQLLNGNVSQATDPWFDEGFAEFFSTIEVDAKEARVGKASENAYQVLQQNSKLKIIDLFRVRHNSAAYNESDRRGVFYAESNMLVHYLYDNQLVPKAALYFDLERTGNVSVEDAIQKAFGMTSAQLDKVLSNYVSSGKSKYFVIPTPPDIVSTGYTTTPFSAADASALMADMHLHSPDYQDKAISEFQEILKTDPDNAAACRGLGYAYLRKHQYGEAGEYFRKAAKLDSKDPRVHYYSAMLMSREGSFASRADLPSVIKELETAIALDPNFADPYSMLGFALAYSGDAAKGLEAMQKAVSLSPRNESYQFNLAQIYMMNRQFDQGIAILRALEKTQNPQLAARVQHSLEQAEGMKETLQTANQRGSTVIIRPRESDDESGGSTPRQVSTTETGGPIEVHQEVPKNIVPIKFIQGTITSVDCSTPPSAILTVLAGSKTWKMKVGDINHMLLFGADQFSCDWKKRKALINYREASANEGNVVSVEIQ